MPYGGPILKVKIKGILLKRVLDFGFLAAGTGAYLQRFNAEKIGDTWFVNNNALNGNKTYTVAFSDYLLKGFDIPFLSDTSPGVLETYTPKESDLAYDIRKAVITYLKTK